MRIRLPHLHNFMNQLPSSRKGGNDEKSMLPLQGLY